MTVLRWFAAVVLVLVAGGARGEAESTKLAEFYGRYQGQGLAKNRENLYFGVTLRDLDTTIESSADGGFIVKWTTVMRDSEGQATRRSDQSLAFKPAGKPGLFVASGTGDPLAGGAFAWARVEGRMLVVNLMEVNPNGAGVWGIYERKLTADGMDLTFRRIEPTGTVRIVSGKLKKQK